MASDEEVQTKQANVQKLREQVAAAEAQRVANETAVGNDIVMAQLDVEEARLQAQLAEAKSAATKTAVKEGTSTTMDALRADQAAAREQAKAAEKAAATDTAKGE